MGVDSDRPAFVDPQTDSVECWVCGQHIEDLSHVEGIDISQDDELYPDMRPACSAHVTDNPDPITEIESGSLQAVLEANPGDELYVEYRVAGSSGIPAIRGRVRQFQYTKVRDHVVTITVDGTRGTVDGQFGEFTFVLVREGDELALDPAIEADLDAQGERTIEITDVETFEIHRAAPNGGRKVDQHQIAPSPAFSALLWLGVGVAVIAGVATVVLATAGRPAAATVTLAMVFLGLTLAGRRWSQ